MEGVCMYVHVCNGDPVCLCTCVTGTTLCVCLHVCYKDTVCLPTCVYMCVTGTLRLRVNVSCYTENFVHTHVLQEQCVYVC